MPIIRAMPHSKRNWALVLGASSGFGEAVSIALAKAGRNVFGVHLDRRATLPNVERIAGEIEGAGGKAVFFNVNAADAQKRAEVVAAMKATLAASGEPLDVVLHSLAFGTLKPFLGDEKERMTRAQMDMTLDVMAHSLVYWVQDLVAAGLLGSGAHVFAMTSAGGHRIWPAYGAVSAAKAALESHCRQLAVELVPKGVAVNAIRAGVTDTPARIAFTAMPRGTSSTASWRQWLSRAAFAAETAPYEGQIRCPPAEVIAKTCAPAPRSSDAARSCTQ